MPVMARDTSMERHWKLRPEFDSGEKGCYETAVLKG